MVMIVFKCVLTPRTPSSKFTSLNVTIKREALHFHNLKNLLRRSMGGVGEAVEVEGSPILEFLKL